ncbi:unnamed protein product [Protopolystoma xenopodis]|uniref:Nucleoid-associated protein n=1 Tax=Protopolystoma xenopodis TaxID=117903 RepID=A0A448WSJ6_9PLAT|nr:unnamed protein product [Protopolystoma xenopodis]
MGIMVNLNQFMKQAQSMQKKMQEAQEQLANTEYQGKAGGGLVIITINGRSEAKKISIDHSLFKEDDKDLLEDLIVAAFNDAKNKVDQDSQNSISDAFGNISLPPGLKLPF